MRHTWLATWTLIATAGCSGNWDVFQTSQSSLVQADPGSVTLHRLNSTEYNNTIHDLLNTSQTPGNNLPADSSAFGFDNNANALTVSDATVRIYQQAAEALAAEATDPNGAELAKLLPCDPNTIGAPACINAFASSFAYRAWRRPVSAADVNDIVAAAVANSNDFVAQVSNVVSYCLMAPEFYFRIEVDPNSTAPHALSSYELASRLSYFLWSSMPDDQLLQAASTGNLQDTNVLLQQTHRMLADSRATALAQNFAGQWLELRELANATPSPAVYPAWNNSLRASMFAESQRYFNDFLAGLHPMTELLTAKFTYVDDRLAAYYGIAAPGSTQVSYVDLPASSPRGGILTQGAWLTTQAHPDRSGIVARGKFVLGQLLCSPVPAPPPNVPALSSSSGFAGTQRQHLDAHAADPTCASCHALLDPIGFAFEEFDGVGVQRTQDANFSVDTTGTFDSQPFADAAGMDALLTADPRYIPCVVTNVFTYALGRAPEDIDTARLSAINQAFAEHGYRLPDLIDLIVTSDAFRMRRGGT